MKEERFYRNGEESRLIFRARSNTLALNDRFRHDKGEVKRDTKCSICTTEYEDLGHFILRCEKLENERDRFLLRDMGGTDEKATLGNLLFRGDMERVGVMLRRMWRARKYWVNRLGVQG